MQFIIKREDILHPLQKVIGVVERRHTIPILSNVLFNSRDSVLTLTATDNEIEMISVVEMHCSDSFNTTVPARKLLDICKALPEEVDITLNISDEKILLTADRSRFTLASLPASDFPILDNIDETHAVTLPQKYLKQLLDNTAFAMAQQDVRYYLNGILLEVFPNSVKLVATDGHRLALSEYRTDIGIDREQQIIIPRKAVIELSRLLDQSNDPVTIIFSQNHIRLKIGLLTFTSKLIDGRFPDYTRVIPVDSDCLLNINRETLKCAMTRISILSNEKYRGVRLVLSNDNLLIQANNPEREEAEEELAVSYSDAGMEIGFNATYFLDVLNVLDSEEILIKLKDTNSSCIISKGKNKKTDDEKVSSLYVIMPMRL